MSEPLIVKNADSYDLDTREQDTRERLEADVHQYANPSGYKNTLGAYWEKKILSFLDRQAAITRRETHQSWQAECDRLEEMRERYTRQLNEISTAFGVEITDDIQTHTNTMKAIKELTAERDELTAELKQERIEWESERDYANQCEKRLDELKTERDELQTAIDAMGNGQMYAMYRQACAERDALCERLEAITAALHDKQGGEE